MLVYEYKHGLFTRDTTTVNYMTSREPLLIQTSYVFLIYQNMVHAPCFHPVILANTHISFSITYRYSCKILDRCVCDLISSCDTSCSILLTNNIDAGIQTSDIER